MSRESPGVVLGVETSCDETSAAVMRSPGELLSHVVLSQDVHTVYGGVVPELAAREHVRRVDRVVARALREAGVGPGDLDAVAVTAGPGLVGPLLVGVCWAKAFSFGLGIPWVPVHHMEAHLFGPVVEDPEAVPPFVALLVSGGHTLLLFAEAWGRYNLLGSTRDDAAGEAFDKVAKALDLPYPGGPHIQRLAELGDPSRYAFPRPLLAGGGEADGPDHFDFSFSGLKTAVAREVERLRSEGRLEEESAHIAAGFQAAVLQVLTEKTARAVKWSGCDRVLVGGGVAANRPLRESLRAVAGEDGRLFVASPRLSLDNGAMVARAGLFRLDEGARGSPDDGPRPDLPFPGCAEWSPAMAPPSRPSGGAPAPGRRELHGVSGGTESAGRRGRTGSG